MEMDDASQMEFERLMMFEQARLMCESNYQQNPNDADNLTRWGGALLELSQFGGINKSKKMVRDATSKLEEALAIDPAKHDALWCVGNALTSQAFLTPDSDEANIYFERATQCFLKAVNQTSIKKKSSDLKYDICGWIILAVGIMSWIGMAKSHVPPPPTR